MSEWAAEISVDAGLARRLIRAQFPMIAADDLALVGEGWDVTAWRVDRDWLFRFPRREVVVAGLVRERAVLPQLAPLLPVGVPAVVFAGEPTDDYPHPFLGSRYLVGAEIGAVRSDDDAELAFDLAAFLRTLHRTDPAAVGGRDLPIDPMGRADMRKRVPMTRARFDELEAHGVWRAPDGIRTFVAAAIDLPPPSVVRLVHGDLHFRQVLVDRRRLSGVVDWIDICVGDPAIDLSPYWSLVGPDERPTFADRYGPIDADQLVRARVLALFLNGTLALYGHVEGHDAVKREALAGLDRACRE
jgi:aminoglycoside phosphotransferase (APT) family kinase protein